MMGSVLVVAVVIAAFGLLVVVHELGHFLAARACGMRVERFSVGFGPVVLRRERHGTEWVISAIPFGGYVRIAGMAPGDDVRPDDPTVYANQAPWRRFAVILAGPAMNWLAAVGLAFAMIVSPVGFPEADPSPTVGELVDGGAAARGGLRPGDRIASADGKPLATWQELVAAVVASPGKPLALEVEREGATVRLTVTPDDAGGRGRLGVGPARHLLRDGPAGAVAASLRITNQHAKDNVTGLAAMFSGRQKAELRGPVGIAQEMAKSAHAGLAPFLLMVWSISVVLAIFNLLPIPALDGGRLVFLAYEIVTRRRVNQRVETIVHTAGFVALFGLILAVTVFGDLARLFRR
jgi:regulator of sigma E protease